MRGGGRRDTSPPGATRRFSPLRPRSGRVSDCPRNTLCLIHSGIGKSVVAIPLIRGSHAKAPSSFGSLATTFSPTALLSTSASRWHCTTAGSLRPTTRTSIRSVSKTRLLSSRAPTLRCRSNRAWRRGRRLVRPPLYTAATSHRRARSFRTSQRRLYLHDEQGQGLGYGAV